MPHAERKAFCVEYTMQAIKCRVGGLKCRVPRGRVKSAQLWFVWRVRGRGDLKPSGLGFEMQLDLFLLLKLGQIQMPEQNA